MYKPQPLQWDDALRTGDETLDKQHKYLIETLNNLGKAITQGNGTEVVAGILGRLRFYTGWHFGREEECFEIHRCPAAEKNKKAHTAFIEAFEKYHAEYRETGGSMELAIKVHEEISNWIINHIMIVDRELYPCIHLRPKTDK